MSLKQWPMDVAAVLVRREASHVLLACESSQALAEREARAGKFSWPPGSGAGAESARVSEPVFRIDVNGAPSVSVVTIEDWNRCERPTEFLLAPKAIPTSPIDSLQIPTHLEGVRRPVVQGGVLRVGEKAVSLGAGKIMAVTLSPSQSAMLVTSASQYLPGGGGLFAAGGAAGPRGPFYLDVVGVLDAAVTHRVTLSSGSGASWYVSAWLTEHMVVVFDSDVPGEATISLVPIQQPKIGH